jgi:hypothetical protein
MNWSEVVFHANYGANFGCCGLVINSESVPNSIPSCSKESKWSKSIKRRTLWRVWKWLKLICIALFQKCSILGSKAYSINLLRTSSPHLVCLGQTWAMFRACPTWPLVYFYISATSTKHSKPSPTLCTSRCSTRSSCSTCPASTSTTMCTCASSSNIYQDCIRQSRLWKRCQSVFSSLNGSFACSATSCLWSCQRDCGTSGSFKANGSIWRSA